MAKVHNVSASDVVHYIHQPIVAKVATGRPNPPKVSVSNPSVSYWHDKNIMLKDLQHCFSIETPYFNSYGTCLGMRLYWHNGHWCMSDNLTCVMTADEQAFFETVPKYFQKLFKHGVKDAMSEYQIIYNKDTETYIYPFKNIKDANKAYVSQVNFQMFYLQVLYFLIESNIGNGLSPVKPQKN